MHLRRTLPLLALLATATPALRAELTLTADCDYTTGAYGEKIDTRILTTALDLEYAHDRWSARLVIPHHTVKGPGDVIPGIARVNGRRRLVFTQTETTERGLGDITLSATCATLATADTPWTLDLTAAVKLPTSDEEKNLGTGETDYSASLYLARPLGPVTPFLSLGYRLVGKPANADLRDHPFASAGLAWHLAERTTLGASYDHTWPTSHGTGSSAEAALFLNHRLSPNWHARLRALAGLTDDAPDWGAGLSLGLAF